MAHKQILENMEELEQRVLYLWKIGVPVDEISSRMKWKIKAVTRTVRQHHQDLPYLGCAENYKGMNIHNYSGYSKQK